MKKFFNDVVTVGYVVSENTGLPMFDVDVEIVDEDEVTPSDDYIGDVEYEDMILKIYDTGDKYIGYFEDEE